ncbi:hypothetical protein [Patulibacter defluvii]|uniref:hypothetical protein n=1 Tax=Patulibacter defluvii TaxID=3095358 RepID=UPI002A74D8DB|nr:hypothetical protein [Patulibacter sp. DM4]
MSADEPAADSLPEAPVDDPETGPAGRRFWRFAGLLAAVGVLLALALGAAFLSIGHSPRPRDLPVAIVGPPAAAQALEQRAPGALRVQPVASTGEAAKLIAERRIYAAVVPSREGGIRRLIVASAASNQAASYLRATLGAAGGQGAAPRIKDVAPLPRDDAGGASIALLLQVITLGGSIGVLGLGRLVPGFRADLRRGVLPWTFLVLYALLFGFVVTGVAAAFGVGSGADYLTRVLAVSLISLAVTASTAGLVSLIGSAGAAITSLLYFVLGAQISGGGTAPEFLPSFWHHLGQNLPTGAGVSLLRQVLYFPDASSSFPIRVLVLYAGIGALILLAVNFRYARLRRTSAAGLP